MTSKQEIELFILFLYQIKKKLKITKEIKTAILVVSSILLFIWGYSYLKGKDLLSNYKSFYVEYSNVEGLSKSAAVTINGLVVGKVSKINLENKTGKLIVELQIKTDFPIAKSSIINIYEPGLIGGKQIEIIPNLKDQNLAENGQVFKGTNRAGLTELVSEKLAPIQEKLDRVLLNADKLLVEINSILDKKTQDNIKNSVAELNGTLEQFHKASENVNSILVENLRACVAESGASRLPLFYRTSILLYP